MVRKRHGVQVRKRNMKASRLRDLEMVLVQDGVAGLSLGGSVRRR